MMNYALSRKNMIEQQIRPWDVLNDSVLDTMEKIPREKFVPPAYIKVAYTDTDIPLGEGQTMLSPKVVGKGLQALNLQGTERVLEIGAGTGYVTACLCALAKEIIALEIKPFLLMQAEKNLNTLAYHNFKLIKADGVLGHSENAPYDAIFVGGSYPLGVPEKLCEQLSPNGGRLFAFYGLAPSMEAVLITRHGEVYSTSVLFETVVPALIGAPSPAKFQF